MKTSTLGIEAGFRAAGSKAALLLGCAALVASSFGCNGSSGIPNLTQSATPLPGLAVYVGPRMSVPRYDHSATSLEDGSVLIVGGTDERHLTAIDEVEIFDQSARVDLALPVPESISGDFIDQDIDGNLITLSNGGRFFHTADSIDDGNVLVIGGTTNINFGGAYAVSEIYDPLTRSFSNPDLILDPDNDISIPRVRHATQRLPSGKLMVSGGQETLTIINPGTNQAQDANPSTRSIEIFDPAGLIFTPALDNNFDTAELTNTRGRSDHACATWAGFDNLIGTGDDIVGFVGGYQTLSAASTGAPFTLVQWNDAHTALTSMDFYANASGSMSLAQGLVLPARQDGHSAMNLGLARQATPFGDFGVANAVLVFNGDNGALNCPIGAGASGTTAVSDLIIASFTGFGPANGARFTQFATGGGLLSAESGQFCPPPDGLLIRSDADAVMMDMTLVADGQPYIGSVLVTCGGQNQFLVMGACTTQIDDSCFQALEGFTLYMPFFDVENIGAPWEIENNETPFNPLGLRGTWLTYDQDIPNGDTLDGFASADDMFTIALNQGRTFHSMTRIPGEDGLLGNLDDRIAVIGGTNQGWPFFGDNAVSNSCEIFLPPEAGAIAP